MLKQNGYKIIVIFCDRHKKIDNFTNKVTNKTENF